MKIIHIAGARPNFMKLAPILRALEPYSDVQNILLHTGQHYDTNMSDVFFDDLKLPKPDINLGVGSGSHAAQTAQIMQGFEQVALAEKPDLVLVVGDVNSTLACSLVASKVHIPVAHVEAGVRSFDRSMPEEINRLVTDVLSEMLFTPSLHANQNLLQQGIPEDKIFFVGNVMVDSLLGALAIARERRAWERWSLSPGEYAVLTLHRASNVDNLPALRNLISTVADVSRRLPVVFPVHPRTLQRMQDPELSQLIAANPGTILSEPLGYLDFLCLLASAKVVLTDSGGIQAETTILGVPCLTLRWNTEWLETLEQGSNHLVGTEKTQILSVLDEILTQTKKPPRYPEGWDGHAGSRIATHISRRFGLE
jgi:UDP-N-acetylglucosamine 2-epimerase (non-hydrolysing)